MTSEPLRVLHLEACTADHEAVIGHSSLPGATLRFTRACTAAEFRAALERGEVDLILADPPGAAQDDFDLLRAARAALPGVPLIVVSGSIGEDRAAECMLNGAWDVVHKERLGKLANAIARAMKGRRASEDSRSPWAEPGEVLAASTKGWHLDRDPLYAQKVEWVGNLASGVAHDLNNQLTVVSGYASMLLDRENLQPAAIDALKRIFTASEQATGVVRQLMLFGRKRAPRLEVVDLRVELEPIVGILRGILGDAVSVAFESEAESIRVNADITMVEQVLMSLALNARDAMDGKGRLAISLQNVSSEEGPFACIRVVDTGTGMDGPVLRRLFTPFFTTKPEGRGTGLGLATSEDIVRRHGGWMEVRTQAGAGSEFRVFLPATSAALTVSERQDDGERARSRILVVEDETGIREFAVAVLQQGGFAVLQAKSAQQALEVWRWHSPRIQLLMTDVVLPGEISGPQLAERLQAEKPSLKVILATGYSKEVLGEQARETTPLHVLHKPYTPRSLLRAVRDALP